VQNPTQFEQAAAALAERGTCITALRAMRDAVLDRELGRERVAVFVVICDHLNAESGMAWPSRERIAELAGTSVKTVANALYDLRSRGYLIWDGKVFTLPSGAGKNSPAGRVPIPPGNAQPGGQECPAGRAKQPGPTGKKVPVTCARDSEPTNRTESEESAAGASLFGGTEQLGVGAHDVGKAGLLAIGVRRFGAEKGQRFETAIPRSTLTLCAKAHKQLKPDEIREIGLAVLDGWVANGDPGHRSTMAAVDKFTADFTAKVRLIAAGAAAPSGKPPRPRPTFVDEEPEGGWRRPPRA
jgi:hypothetical protein